MSEAYTGGCACGAIRCEISEFCRYWQAPAGCSELSFLPVAIEYRRDLLVRRELTPTCFVEA